MHIKLVSADKLPDSLQLSNILMSCNGYKIKLTVGILVPYRKSLRISCWDQFAIFFLNKSRCDARVIMLFFYKNRVRVIFSSPKTVLWLVLWSYHCYCMLDNITYWTLLICNMLSPLGVHHWIKHHVIKQV